MSASHPRTANSPATCTDSEQSRNDALAWRELALDSLVSGEPASGLWFLRNAIELDSNDPETWQLMGRCFEEMGEESRARRCFLLAFRQQALTGLPAQSLPSMAWRRRATREV